MNDATASCPARRPRHTPRALAEPWSQGPPPTRLLGHFTSSWQPSRQEGAFTVRNVRSQTAWLTDSARKWQLEFSTALRTAAWAAGPELSPVLTPHPPVTVPGPAPVPGVGELSVVLISRLPAAVPGPNLQLSSELSVVLKPHAPAAVHGPSQIPEWELSLVLTPHPPASCGPPTAATSVGAVHGSDSTVKGWALLFG